MPNVGVNLSRFNILVSRAFSLGTRLPLRAQNPPKNSKKINKNPNDLKLLFLELAHLGLYSGKVWENRFFFYILHDLS